LSLKIHEKLESIFGFGSLNVGSILLSKMKLDLFGWSCLCRDMKLLQFVEFILDFHSLKVTTDLTNSLCSIKSMW